MREGRDALLMRSVWIWSFEMGYEVPQYYNSPLNPQSNLITALLLSLRKHLLLPIVSKPSSPLLPHPLKSHNASPASALNSQPSHLCNPHPENSSWSLRLPPAAPPTRLAQSALLTRLLARHFPRCVSRTLPSKKDVRQLPHLNTSQLHVLGQRWDGM
jgi:hypothetical protein